MLCSEIRCWVMICVMTPYKSLIKAKFYKLCKERWNNMGAETYLKAFFTVMPKRFKLIGDLRNEKRRIEGLLINKGKTDAKDKIVQYCDELTQLIGKDTLFRKAERRNKYTLRHLRSEEHTSELQSHVNLVCRLLLEKKK